MLLERASEADDRGDISGFDCESADAAMGMPEGATQAIYDAMTAKGMIVNERIAKWEERQPKREDSTSAQRSREYRDRKKAEKINLQHDETEANAMQHDETQCNTTQRKETPDEIRGEDINLDSASGDAANPPASAKPEGKKKKGRPPDGPFYQSKNGAYLTGDVLTGFERFWEAFDFRHGKAEAADAWIAIKSMTPELLARICDAVSQEAERREYIQAKGQTPKWAQGWLNSRRWEDYEPRKPRAPNSGNSPWERTPSEEEWRKAQEMRKKLEAERRARMGEAAP